MLGQASAGRGAHTREVRAPNNKSCITASLNNFNLIGKPDGCHPIIKHHRSLANGACDALGLSGTVAITTQCVYPERFPVTNKAIKTLKKNNSEDGDVPPSRSFGEILEETEANNGSLTPRRGARPRVLRGQRRQGLNTWRSL